MTRWASLPAPTTATWHDGVWRAESIAIAIADDRFAREAERLEAELAELGIAVDSAAPTSVTFRAGACPREAFSIAVDDDVVIAASTPAGAFYATRALVNNLRASGSMPRGVFTSSPSVAERGVHLDTARAYYPAAWMRAFLHQMASVSLNTLQWHFSENEGIRIAGVSGTLPVSHEHLTVDEVRDLLELAADLHIDVVPSLDMPGHLKFALAELPELRLADDARALDISRPAAIEFAKQLIDDYAPIFKYSTSWNLGADEFLDVERTADPPALVAAAERRFGSDANAYDLITWFANAIADHLRERGFTARVWNDGMFRGNQVALASDIELTWWTNWNKPMAPLGAGLDAGHRILNFDDAHLYFVLGENAGYTYPTSQRLWRDNWHPGLFPALPGGARQELAIPYPAQLGGAFISVWSDKPEALAPAEVAALLWDPLAGFAERSWNGGSTLSHAEFVSARDGISRP